MTASDDTFTLRLAESGVIDPSELAEYGSSRDLPDRLVRDGRLTRFQVELLRSGRSLVVGEYLLVDRLGAGGMGEVLRAVHRRMDRTVAVKILPEHMLGTPNALARFEREARAAARLVHPNVVTAYDAGEQDGVHYLVTEFVDGPDLGTYVAAHGALSVPEAVDVVRQAAEGLAYAHGEGVIHRDVKPSNLLVDGRGRVRILDMGIARLEHVDPSRAGDDSSDLTGTGTVMGTLDYMSPEQAMQSKDADARSDLYSLGCTLHFLLTGRRPYGGATPMIRLLAHRESPLPALSELVPDVPDELAAVHQRLLAKAPADRFQTAEELIEALDGMESTRLAPRAAAQSSFFPEGAATIVAGSPDDDGETRLTDERSFAPPEGTTLAVDPPSTVEPESRESPSRKPLWIGGIATGVVAMLAVLFGVDWFGSAKPDGPNHALRFNGRSSYLHVPTLDITEHESFTIECWVEVDEPRLSNVVNWFGPGWFSLYYTPPNFGVGKLGSEPAALAVAPGTAVPGRRRHLAAVWDGRLKHLFVDGRPIELQIAGYVPLETRGGFYVGGAPPDALPENEFDRWFSGTVDEVRVSRGARYTEAFDPRQRLVADGTTVALYNLDEGEGTIAHDSSGNGHEGRVVDATWVDVADEPEPARSPTRP